MAAVATAAVFKFNSINNNKFKKNNNKNKNNAVGLFRPPNSIPSSSITTASSFSSLGVQFPPSRPQYHHLHGPHGPHRSLGIRCLSDSNGFSLKKLKEYFDCYPILLSPCPKTPISLAERAERQEKLEPFFKENCDRIIILLKIYVQEDNDGMVKRKLSTIDSVQRKWDNIDTIMVDDWDPDRQHFLMCLLNDACKCLLENKDRWICGFSNVSKTKLQHCRDLIMAPEPLDLFDLSPTENTKHKIGCSKLFMFLMVKDPIISFSDKGIHSRQDVEAILEQFTALEGKLSRLYVSQTSVELDKEKVDQLQGYHHVNSGEHLCMNKFL